MFAPSKSLSLFLVVAATSMNAAHGFNTAFAARRHQGTVRSVSLSSENMGYSTMASTSTTNIAPPAMNLPTTPQQVQEDAFFASPSDDTPMPMEMTSPVEPDQQAFKAAAAAAAAATFAVAPISAPTPQTTRKVVKFTSDGGIMMRANKPFPTKHKVKPLLLGHRKAGFKPEGIMMAATKSVPQKKKNKNAPPSLNPKESSSTHPNTATFQWKPAAVAPNGKLQWRQREIDSLPMPATK